MDSSEWIYDKELAGIDPEKLTFIKKVLFDSKKLKEQEKMPYLLALITKARTNRIEFTKDETERVVSVIRKYSSPQEVQQIEQLLKMSTFFK